MNDIDSDAPERARRDALARADNAAVERARRVKLMLFDVDGVLTDGRLWYGPSGEALKSFSVLDGHGIRQLMHSGITVALLSGRASAAVAARASELGIPHVLQGIEDKLASYSGLCATLGIGAAQTGFAGDELVDLPVLRRCGFACAPREAHEEVRKHVHYLAQAPAGRGAVREICDFLMRAQGTLDAAYARYLA